MVNPRNLAEVWAILLAKRSAEDASVSFHPEMRKGLDANLRDEARNVKANFERGTDDRRVVREINDQGEGVRDITRGCRGPRDLRGAFYSHQDSEPP